MNQQEAVPTEEHESSNRFLRWLDNEATPFQFWACMIIFSEITFGVVLVYALIVNSIKF